MMAMTKNQFIEGLVHWKLAQSISHMKDKTDIDLRLYMLTVNMKKNSVPAMVIDDCYQTIMYHLNLGKKGDIPQHRLPGLLWSYDDAGSRAGRITTLKAHPHLHAILIFPKKMDRYEFNVPVRSLEDRLEKLPGVAPWYGASRPVHLKPFVVQSGELSGTPYDQLMGFCSYALKGERIVSQSHQHSPSFRTSGVLPFDILPSETQRELDITVQRVSRSLGSAPTRFRHVSRSTQCSDVDERGVKSSVEQRKIGNPPRSKWTRH